MCTGNGGKRSSTEKQDRPRKHSPGSTRYNSYSTGSTTATADEQEPSTLNPKRREGLYDSPPTAMKTRGSHVPPTALHTSAQPSRVRQVQRLTNWPDGHSRNRRRLSLNRLEVWASLERQISTGQVSMGLNTGGLGLQPMGLPGFPQFCRRGRVAVTNSSHELVMPRGCVGGQTPTRDTSYLVISHIL